MTKKQENNIYLLFLYPFSDMEDNESKYGVEYGWEKQTSIQQDRKWRY